MQKTEFSILDNLSIMSQFQTFNRQWISNIKTSFQKINSNNEFLTILPHLPNNLHLDKITKSAAVLIPICNRHNQASLLFNLRSLSVGTHRGQVSFPGGHIELNETPIEAAIREINEELGSGIGPIEILGVCQTIPAITGTLVTPVLAFITNDVKDFEELSPNESEVSRIFTRSIIELESPNYKTYESITRNNKTTIFPTYGNNDDERIWGLTAVILESVMKNMIIPNYSDE